MSLRATFRPLRASEYARAGGPWDQPTLDQLLQTSAAHHRDRVLVVDGATRCTGDQLESAVAQLAGYFVARGVQAGDAVAWQRANDLGAVVALRACWRIGAVAVPMHHAFSAVETDRLVQRVEPTLVLSSELDAVAQFQAVDDSSTTPVRTAWSDGAALAAVLFTSGSSGEPKGVLHTQHTLAYKARTMGAVHGLGADDTVLMPAPLAHVSGLLNGVTLPGVVGMKSVLMARWDPEVALRLIADEDVSFMVGPPTFFISMMQSQSFTPETVHSLRLVSSGGAGVSSAFVEGASATLGAHVKRTYGSTEAPTVATSGGDDRADAAHSHDGRAIGAVELNVAADGELLIRGPEVCVGYLDEATTRTAFDRDGWYHSGDRAQIDHDGWLTITGRIADTIIRGGENISAAEVQSVLEQHPEIAQAVAVAYPDDRLGERVCACIVTTGAALGVTDIAEWFERQGVARYKTPERVVLLEALPLLASGKPDRVALQALASS